MSNLVIRVPQSLLLPDNDRYTNRFYIKSESVDRNGQGKLYTVAQSKSGKWWSCSCFGWVRHKKCKHLRAIGIPEKPYTPFEAKLEAKND
jgi:hypothetical protein